MPAPWTVELTLLGRHDGQPVPGVGETTYKGDFASYTAAREAVESWERDTTFR